jgi:hypothetical protein
MKTIRLSLAICGLVLALPAAAHAAMVFPDGDVVKEGLGDSGTTVAWAPPQITGDNDVLSGPNCNPDSGDHFPVGATEVECFATLKVCAEGPGGLCIVQPLFGRFDVTVTPGEGPALSAFRNITVTAPAGADGATVDYALPVATDPSGVASLGCTPPPGSQLPIGSTEVTCTATDEVGNASVADFVVTVLPTVLANPPAAGGPGAGGSGGDGTSPRANAARIEIGRRIRVRRGIASVTLACPKASATTCAGTLKLAGKRKRFAVAPGARKRASVRLGRAAKRRLATRKRLRIRAVADQAGELTRRSFTVRRR